MMRYRHASQLITRVVDGEAFIIAPKTIRHLSTSGSVIWLAFEQPATKPEVLQFLSEIYPAIDRKVLSRDLGALLKSLLAEKLIIRSSEPVARKAGRRHSKAR